MFLIFNEHVRRGMLVDAVGKLLFSFGLWVIALERCLYKWAFGCFGMIDVVYPVCSGVMVLCVIHG